MTQYQFKQNKYSKHYYLLIKKAISENRNKHSNVCYENHHILPKSLGGGNDKVNLVYLTPKEHFIAHLLLIKIVHNSDVYRMVNAIRRFKSGNRITTATEYNILRNIISNNSKGVLNPSFGKRWIHNINNHNEILYVTATDYEQNYDHSIYSIGLPFQRGGHRNTVRINNGIEETLCSKDKLNDFLLNGWVKGRLRKATSDHMKSMSKNRHTIEKDKAHSLKLTGRIAVVNLDSKIVKRIHPDQFEEYKANGFILRKGIRLP